MRKLLALILVLALLVPYTVFADSGTFYPDSSPDDGYWFSSASFNNTANGAIVGTTDFNSFVLFENVTIPKSATITAAFVRFICQTSYAPLISTVMYFEAADTATACSSHANCDAKSTTTGTAWNNIASWTVDNSYDSVDLSSELQEIVDRSGWSSGNDMQLLWWFSSGSSYRTFYQWDSGGAGANKVELHVTWTTGGSSWTLDVGGVSAANVGEIGDTPIANIDKFGGTDGTP